MTYRPGDIPLLPAYPSGLGIIFKDLTATVESSELLPNIENRRDVSSYKQRMFEDPKGYRKPISEVNRDSQKPRKEAFSIAVFGTRITFHGEMLDRFFATYRKIFGGKNAHLPGNKKRRASKFRDLRENVDLDMLVFRSDISSEQAMNLLLLSDEDPVVNSTSIHMEVDAIELDLPDALKGINDYSVDLQIAREDSSIGKLMRCILRLEKYVVQQVPTIVLKDGAAPDRPTRSDEKAKILDCLLIAQRFIMWARAFALLSAVPKGVIHGASRILSQEEGAPPPRKKHMTRIETTAGSWSDGEERQEGQEPPPPVEEEHEY
mmetsp:Transcript_20830/g.53757  ORF Transcript_20830/g.53757 Transcript_20830/m.53757 type:complete len:320 (-) Transcript_20830:1697-2656(-)|eukprot:CAMPEP_0113876476 /NCGR_PEP_ID=MMETSP0780_2-20120614/5512_1 /TAXON_ID=652834 /ORGANISM="Palpitomonas bilix" /LENGTH=319 /DNA_ID=CAMNT_0000862567 /DNA_START=343 /DNA_END=1302 /DNA_ORIENTATION=- /assembly_acc=CAM_ASM_000599